MTASKRMMIEAAGLTLCAQIEGPENGATPALLLHGFTGSAESMGCVSEPLARDRRIARLELVGHGESEAPQAVDPYRMSSCVAQVLAAVTSLGFERPHLVGYSMGGRTALATVVAAPARFASVTLIGATAGIADAAARQDRVAADEALADRIEREGLEPFVDYWMSLPIFASQSRLGEESLERARAERLRNRPHGLANSLRGMGAGAQEPVFDRLGDARLPALLVVGEEDEKFRGLAKQLAGSLPDARIEIIQGVGHAAHLEDPTAFEQTIRAFYSELESA